MVSEGKNGTLRVTVQSRVARQGFGWLQPDRAHATTQQRWGASHLGRRGRRRARGPDRRRDRADRATDPRGRLRRAGVGSGGARRTGTARRRTGAGRRGTADRARGDRGAESEVSADPDRRGPRATRGRKPWYRRRRAREQRGAGVGRV